MTVDCALGDRDQTPLTIGNAGGAGGPSARSSAAAQEGEEITMLRRVVAAARVAAHADAAAILLYDRERDRFVPTTPRVALGLDERWLQGQGLEATQALAWRAMETGDLIDVPDTTATPDLDYPLLAGRVRPGAVVVAPLLVEGNVVGVLRLYDARPRATPADARLLGTFAALAGAAIAAARGHERERSLRTRLEVLDGAARVVAAELSLDQVLQRIVEAAVAVVGARYGALGVVGPDGYLSDFITVGLTAEERARLGRLPRGHGLLGVLIRQGEPLRVTNIRRDPRRVGFPPGHPAMTSLLGVPVRVRGEVVGDLYLTDKGGAPEFSDDDQRLLELLAAHAGIAIENARLHGQLREVTMRGERDRIARDLHDAIIQDIYAVTLQLESVAEDMPDGAGRWQILGLADQLSDVIGGIRTYIHGLQARELAGRPLQEGIALLVEQVDGRSGMSAMFALEGQPYRLLEAQAHALLQIAREALANVVKHARAARAEVRLGYAGAGVTLTVADDGQGFDPEAAVSAEHLGLRNLRRRAEEAGGTCTVRSSPGGGTIATVFLPAG